MTDYRELVIEDLAGDLREAERMRDSYRELLNLTLNQLHEALTREHARRTLPMPAVENRRAA